ncbi:MULTISPECIES: WD40/YVTN/BNR-like repeat-containing protein [Flavobacteriaceae]|uniref:WD40/YVTN/BNR-like repeat-containing protein n=1 Tax=Flavobacteriaceae TaxID=49546 RepID=UPI001491BC90|nr:MULTISPECIES: sialidase family protein [Allomuricauda]MDC6364678.1 glycosyl hydrolase [Muricauda sp. AC10]
MKQNYSKIFPALLLFISCSLQLFAQNTDSTTYSGLEFRSIGPALTSGRIADIAIHPKNESVWYVAVGSGGVWKTINAGTTWKPIFDKQTCYSIGCVTIDPNNPSTVWVGTGENVGGRHVGFGDGIYVSHDEGNTWKNVGLKSSEHISKIIVHPANSNVVWAAVQGPLWSKGGERGLYKSTDGGKSWKKTLGNNEWTGVTDIVIDPTNPDVLYAATWDRHRTVAAYMGGGPGSGIHKSIDGGETWTKLTSGIPTSNLGKIGLAISPFDNETIYAAIELDRKKGGLFISKNQGASWSKQSDAVSGGTGPHYYQELYASPHQNGKLYLMSNTVQISDDHGKHFEFMNEDKKHVDSHAMAFKKSDPDYVLFGTDGGLYESYDLTKTWRFFANLPLTQYYKIAVDDAEPFYHIYGGTQDNGSHGGPSRTKSSVGILNSDWWITLGADGHQSATEPGNPDITYGEFQQGWLWRIDQTTGETVYIQPQPAAGDPYERFNWDAPILVSPHNPKRLYFASYRVWKSENRGDDWTSISSDLTRNEERLSLPILGRQQSWDNPWDVAAMSNYNTITSLAESPVQEGLIYAGTDDGILQVTENGGSSWRKIMLGNIKGVPNRAFVNDVRADLYDANTVYLLLDNHKEGDFKPYVLKSTDRGNTWSLINGNLPKRLLTWRIVQDHKKPGLLFLASEFGVYFTKNSGGSWIKLDGGLPTISFRDITIQRREDDLVAGSFGRGIYILDDISALRDFDASKKDATLFKVKPAYWYIQKDGVYGQGHSEYAAKNPPYGATFTYFLPEKLTSLKEVRTKKEKDLNKQKSNIAFPGWGALADETNQEQPAIELLVKDSNGNVVNTVSGTNKKGFNRVAWNLTYADRAGIPLKKPSGGGDDFFGSPYLATPGNYTVELYKRVDGELKMLSEPQTFIVQPLEKGALPSKPTAEIDAFRQGFQKFQQDLTATNKVLERSLAQVDAMKRALDEAERPSAALSTKIYNAKVQLLSINAQLKGNPAKNEIGENNALSPEDGSFIGYVALGNTYGPTGNQKTAMQRAKSQLQDIKKELTVLVKNTLPALESELKAAGAPWIEGQGLIQD